MDRSYLTNYGIIDHRLIVTAEEQFAVASMSQPVRCARCSGIYDLGRVEVTARYADCSVWKAPCCGSVVDDRGETGWKPTKDYYRLDGGAR